MRRQNLSTAACAPGQGRVKQLVLAAFSALVAVTLMAPASAWAAGTQAGAAHVTNPGGASANDDVLISKTATDAQEADTFNVRLTVEGSETRDNVAVVFVFDKSTSTDVRAAAREMIAELKEKTRTNIKVAVVNFNARAVDSGWLSLNDEAAETIENAFIKPESVPGSNIEAGILRAQALLNSPEVAGYDTYSVVVSDGLSYMWNAGNVDSGKPQSVWVERTGNEAGAQNGLDAYDIVYNHGSTIMDNYGSVESFLSTMDDKLANTVGSFTLYEDKYVQGDTPTVLDTEAGVEGSKCGNVDAAIYYTIQAYRNLTSRHTYAYAIDKGGWSNFPFGKEVMGYLAEATDGADISDGTARKYFDSIADEIQYAVDKGVVTDVMGSAVDFVDSEALLAYVTEAGETYAVQLIKGDDGAYVDDDDLFRVTVVTNDEGEETLSWAINGPLSQGKQVALDYSVKLPAANKASEVGTYDELTNEGAVFEYTSTNSDEGTLEFAKPVVTYEVTEVAEPAAPAEPEQAQPVKGTPLAQTGDPLSAALPLVALAAVACVGAGVLAWRKAR